MAASRTGSGECGRDRIFTTGQARAREHRFAHPGDEFADQPALLADGHSKVGTFQCRRYTRATFRTARS
jgi:hypothetical protein